MGLPSVSIIIPVNRINDFIVENVEHLKQLDYTDFEVLVFYTEDGGPVLENPPSFLRLIRTDLVKPGDKRDLALEHAKGEVFAFIDDDVIGLRAITSSDFIASPLPLTLIAGVFFEED